jgi:hypothetical protein
VSQASKAGQFDHWLSGSEESANAYNIPAVAQAG